MVVRSCKRCFLTIFCIMVLSYHTSLLRRQFCIRTLAVSRRPRAFAPLSLRLLGVGSPPAFGADSASKARKDGSCASNPGFRASLPVRSLNHLRGLFANHDG